MCWLYSYFCEKKPLSETTQPLEHKVLEKLKTEIIVFKSRATEFSVPCTL